MRPNAFGLAVAQILACASSGTRSGVTSPDLVAYDHQVAIERNELPSGPSITDPPLRDKRYPPLNPTAELDPVSDALAATEQAVRVLEDAIATGAANQATFTDALTHLRAALAAALNTPQPIRSQLPEWQPALENAVTRADQQRDRFACARTPFDRALCVRVAAAAAHGAQVITRRLEDHTR